MEDNRSRSPKKIQRDQIAAPRRPIDIANMGDNTIWEFGAQNEPLFLSKDTTTRNITNKGYNN